MDFDGSVSYWSAGKRCGFRDDGEERGSTSQDLPAFPGVWAVMRVWQPGGGPPKALFSSRAASMTYCHNLRPWVSSLISLSHIASIWQKAKSYFVYQTGLVWTEKECLGKCIDNHTTLYWHKASFLKLVVLHAKCAGHVLVWGQTWAQSTCPLEGLFSTQAPLAGPGQVLCLPWGPRERRKWCALLRGSPDDTPQIQLT